MIHEWAMESKKPWISASSTQFTCLLQDSDMESVQRIVLASSRPEPIGEADEVFLVDRLQHRHDRLLDDLVLQAPDAQRALGAVRLRNVAPLGRARSIAAFVNPFVQVFEFIVEIFSVGLPRHAVDAGRSVSHKREIALLQ